MRAVPTQALDVSAGRTLDVARRRSRSDTAPATKRRSPQTVALHVSRALSSPDNNSDSDDNTPSIDVVRSDEQVELGAQITRMKIPQDTETGCSKNHARDRTQGRRGQQKKQKDKRRPRGDLMVLGVEPFLGGGGHPQTIERHTEPVRMPQTAAR